jgi:hypothetical protein
VIERELEICSVFLPLSSCVSPAHSLMFEWQVSGFERSVPDWCKYRYIGVSRMHFKGPRGHCRDQQALGMCNMPTRGSLLELPRLHGLLALGSLGTPLIKTSQVGE